MQPLNITPFGHFVRLYTLHQIEHVEQRATGSPNPALLVLRVRIETLRYTFAPLPALPLQDAYEHDPRAGIELVREAVVPRLQTLLDAREPFRELGLEGARDAAWQRYATARGLPAAPVPVPTIDMPTAPRQLPARSLLSVRLARAQQALELFKTAADTAATLAALWQNWQLGQEQRKLLTTQRGLLQDAIQAQLTGQTTALNRALDQDFVRGYLADHAEDTGYTELFDSESLDTE